MTIRFLAILLMAYDAKILPASAVLEVSAVCLFFTNLVMTLMQPIPAWFSLSGVTHLYRSIFTSRAFRKRSARD